MTLNLDPELEQRIQREIDLGHYRQPADVIHRALDLLEADQSWSDEEKADLDERYEQGMAACDRGEGVPGDKVRELLASRRAARIA